MNLFVDTSVWSLAWRRDASLDTPEVARLSEALRSDETIRTTGLVLQELLQGFQGAKAQRAIVERFSALQLIVPDRQDHIEAAALRSFCRRRGVQLGTIDALLVRLCVRYELTLLTTDRDFEHAARHVALKIWSPSVGPSSRTKRH